MGLPEATRYAGGDSLTAITTILSLAYMAFKFNLDFINLSYQQTLKAKISC